MADQNQNASSVCSHVPRYEWVTGIRHYPTDGEKNVDNIALKRKDTNRSREGKNTTFETQECFR